MTTRSELYANFGVELLEAITLIIKDEINILRVEAGLEERTNQQLINSIKNRMDTEPEFPYAQEMEDAIALAEERLIEAENEYEPPPAEEVKRTQFL